MTDKKIVVTEDMVRQAAAGMPYAWNARQRRQVADYLTKLLNPPTWQHEGDGSITYKDGRIRVLVRGEFGRREGELRERVAELIVGVLNERGVQVDVS